MSRTKSGFCCALLALAVAVQAGSLSAQEKSASYTAATSGDAAQTARDRINAILDQPLKTPLEAVETPLIEMLNQFQSDYDFPIVFDNAALDEVAVSPETEVTINLRKIISLRSALELILRQPGLEDLTYVIDHEVLLITTEDRANETLVTRVYRVDDLGPFFHQKKPSDSDPACFSSLVETIVDCVERGSWKENGMGEGQIQLLRPGILVVAQTNRVHRQVKELLDALRAVRTEMQKEATR